MKKKFPNGFTSWKETHHEVVSFIATQLNHEPEYRDEEHPIYDLHDSEGTNGIYQLAENWTDEFEKLHTGRKWDGDFFDEIERFLNDKIATP